MNTNTDTPAGTTPEESLAHAALFESLALCFRSSPRESPQSSNSLRPLVNESPERWRSKFYELAILMEQATDEQHQRLFGNAGLCHECESAYVTNRPMGSLLADVAGFYRAFGFSGAGFQPAESQQDSGRLGSLPHGAPTEPHDHIATELSFVSFLFAKEAHARFSGNVLAADICHRARELFLHEHLGTWTASFAASVGQHAPGSGYERAATLIRDVLIDLGIGEATRAECAIGINRQSARPDDSLCGMCQAAGSTDQKEWL